MPNFDGSGSQKRGRVIGRGMDPATSATQDISTVLSWTKQNGMKRNRPISCRVIATCQSHSSA